MEKLNQESLKQVNSQLESMNKMILKLQEYELEK